MTSVPDATEQRRLLRYNKVSVAIHWVSALLIVGQVAGGFLFENLERGPARAEIFTWHKTIGVTILLLSLVRLGWRLANPPPPYPDSMPRWERLAGTWNHRIFYVLLLALPLTGLAAVSARADGPFTELVGGIPFPVIPGLSAEALGALGGLHELLVYTTLVLLAVHVGAALKHQFVDRARYAGRMPPFRSPDGETAVAPAGQPGAAS